MLFASVHMISETIGWAVGAPKGQRDFMGWDIKWCLFHTMDGGHWKTVNTWDNSITPFFLSETTAFVSVNGQLMSTHNAGTDWEVCTLPLTPDKSVSITHLTFSDTRTGWLIAHIFDPSASSQSVRPHVLCHTNDGGATWMQLLNRSEKLPLPTEVDNGITFLTATTGWITMGTLLFKTCDGGRTWYPQTLPLPVGAQSRSNLKLATPRFFSAQDGVLPACRTDFSDQWPGGNNFSGQWPDGFVVFVTHDGGQSWQSQPFVLKNYNQVSEKKLQEWIAKEMKKRKSGQFTITRSLIYWVTRPPNFTDMQFAWAGHPALEISLTHDGGEHWEELPPLPQGTQQLQFLNRHIGWCLQNRTESSSSIQLSHKTMDGGKTWQPVPPATN